MRTEGKNGPNVGTEKGDPGRRKKKKDALGKGKKKPMENSSHF